MSDWLSQLVGGSRRTTSLGYKPPSGDDWLSSLIGSRRESGQILPPVSLLGGLSDSLLTEEDTQGSLVGRSLLGADDFFGGGVETALGGINEPINWLVPKAQGLTQALDAGVAVARKNAKDYGFQDLTLMGLAEKAMGVDDETYAKAQAANEEGFRQTWGRDPDNGLESLLTVPQFGDLAVEAMDMDPGLFRTATQLGANILSSPTNLLGGVLSKAPTSVTAAVTKQPGLFDGAHNAVKAMTQTPVVGALFAPDIAKGLEGSIEAFGEAEGFEAKTSAAASAALMAILGTGAVKGVTGELKARSAARAKAVDDARIMAENASGGVPAALQPTISKGARETLGKVMNDLQGAATKTPEELAAMSQLHIHLADAWEKDVQVGKKAAAVAVEKLGVKDPEGATDVLSAINHYVGANFGQEIQGRLESMAERLANRRRLQKLNQLAEEGDEVAPILAAELGTLPILRGQTTSDAGPVTGATIEGLIELRAWERVRDNPRQSVQRALRESFSEVMGQTGKSLLDKLDPQDQNWQTTVKNLASAQNPLDMDALSVARASDSDVKTKREALGLRRRLDNPEVDEATHKKWDEVSAGLAKVWASVDTTRSEADWYQLRLDGTIKPNLLAEAGNTKRLFSPFLSDTDDGFVEGLRKAYAEELKLKDKDAAKALVDMPIEDLKNKIESRDGSDPLVNGLVDFGTTIYRTGLVDPADPAKRILGPVAEGPPVRPGMNRLQWGIDKVEAYQGMRIPAKDLIGLAKGSDMDALRNMKERITKDIAPPTARTISQWASEALPSMEKIGASLRRAVLSPLFRVKNQLFNAGKRAGDLTAFNSLSRAVGDIHATADTARRVVLRATERTDRFNPGASTVSGHGLKGIMDRLANIKAVNVDGDEISYADVFNAIVYGEHAEHAWDKAVENLNEGRQAVRERPRVIAERLQAKRAVEELARQGKIPADWIEAASMDAQMYRDWAWRAMIDPLADQGLISKETVDKLRAASVRYEPVAEGMEGPPAPKRTWAPISKVMKILEEENPGLTKEAREAIGENVINAFDEMDLSPDELATMAKEGAKAKAPLWRREAPIDNKSIILDPVRAAGHRAILANAAAARQKVLNTLPDLLVRSMLPQDNPLRIDKNMVMDLNMAYAGEKDMTVDVNGTKVLLRANTKKARELQKAGGANIVAMYDGKKVPFYVDNDLAKDMSTISRDGAKAVMEATASSFQRYMTEYFPALANRTAKVFEPLGRMFRMATTGTVNFALKEMARNPHGASVRSGRWEDMIPYRNLLNGMAISLGEKLGVDLGRPLGAAKNSLGGKLSDSRLFELMSDFGYGQSSIAYDLKPTSGNSMMQEIEAILPVYRQGEGESGTLQAPPTKQQRIKAGAQRTFENLTAMKGKGATWRAWGLMKDLFHIAPGVGDEPIRADAMVQEGRDILKSITPEQRATERQTNGAVYDEWVRTGREEEYWLLKNRLRIADVGRNANLDFVNRGNAHATLNALEPFTGVGFIDAEAQYWAFRKNPTQYVTKAATLIALPAILEGIHAANDPLDDERSMLGVMMWQKMPDADLNPFVEGRTNILIPRPQGYLGALSFAIRTATKEFIQELNAAGDHEAVAETTRKVLGAFTESTPVVNWGLSYDEAQSGLPSDAGVLPDFNLGRAVSGVLPFGIDTAVEAYADKNTYFGGNIKPQYDLEVREQNAYRPWFIEASKKFTGLSPFQVDYFLSGTTGGSGSITKVATNKGQREGDSMAATVGGKFLFNPPKSPIGYRSLSVQNLESLFKKIDQDKKVLDAYEKRGDEAGWVSFKARNPHLNDERLFDFIKEWRETQKTRRDMITWARNSDDPVDVRDGNIYSSELEMTVEAQQRLQLLRSLPEFSHLFNGANQ